MPKKLNTLTWDEQSQRFKREVERLIEVGDLNPTDADAALDALVKRSIKDHGA